MRRVTGWWIMIPVALLLFGFIFAASAATVSAQASPGAGISGGVAGQPQNPSTSVPVGGQVIVAPGNPFVFVLPTQPVATGPALAPSNQPYVYPQYSPRRLRDG